MSLFISHGAPTLLLDSTPAHRFLQRLGGEIPRPRAIIVVSAHWESLELQVDDAGDHSLIHDFSGFPRALHEFQWPAQGDPQLAGRIVEALEQAGLGPKQVSNRGLDHGAWVPLALLDPSAAVPVVPVSLPMHFDEEQLWQLGAILGGFEREGYLLIGTGSLTHNLRARSASWDAPARPEITPFLDAITAALLQGDRHQLMAWRQLPNARWHHPSPEHFLPLLVAAAAGGEATRLHHSVEYGVLAMDCWQFGAGTNPASRLN